MNLNLCPLGFCVVKECAVQDSNRPITSDMLAPGTSAIRGTFFSPNLSRDFFLYILHHFYFILILFIHFSFSVCCLRVPASTYILLRDRRNQYLSYQAWSNWIHTHKYWWHIFLVNLLKLIQLPQGNQSCIN